jgi:hypothetical protein
MIIVAALLGVICFGLAGLLVLLSGTAILGSRSESRSSSGVSGVPQDGGADSRSLAPQPGGASLSYSPSASSQAVISLESRHYYG